MRSPHLTTIVLFLAACAEPTSVAGDILRVQRELGGLALQNNSAVPVHYFVVERETAARINWLACAGPPCPAIDPNAQVRVLDEQIMGFSSSAHEAIVYWWRAVPDGEGHFRADSIRSLIAPL